MTKVNPDYTGSAINLVNPAEVKALLLIRSALEEKHLEKANLLEQTHEYQDVADLTDQLRENYEQVKRLVEQMGSYQDVPQGWYAIAQRRISYQYIPDRVRATFPPDLASRVITESVDKIMVEKLVRGGLIEQEQAENCRSITKEETAFIIKV